jgi:hypothetical protein
MLGLALAAAACDATGAEDSDEIPAGFDETELAASLDKADWAGPFWVRNEGPIGCAEQRAGKTGPFGLFDGYTLKSTKGAKIGFDATADHRARLLLYGPKKNGHWGGVRLSTWLAYNAQAKAFRATVKHTIAADGTYLVVIGSYVAPAKYELSYYCDSQPHCVEYIATDDQGASLRNFYAINVSSYQEGKDHLAQLAGHFLQEAITPGTCASLSTACVKIYAPVCAADITPDNGPEPRTFGNLCEFKAAVRQTTALSTWNGAKGHYDDGECKTACTPGDKQYVGTPQTCPLIRFTCAFDQGYSYFSDSKGCGCECKAP